MNRRPERARGKTEREDAVFRTRRDARRVPRRGGRPRERRRPRAILDPRWFCWFFFRFTRPFVPVAARSRRAGRRGGGGPRGGIVHRSRRARGRRGGALLRRGRRPAHVHVHQDPPRWRRRAAPRRGRGGSGRIAPDRGYVRGGGDPSDAREARRRVEKVRRKRRRRGPARVSGEKKTLRGRREGGEASAPAFASSRVKAYAEISL